MTNPQLLRLATWNIGGGIIGESHQRGAVPSLEYYASVLEKNQPDVLCLQEAHDYRGYADGQSQDLANRLGYPYVASFPISESHMVDNATLSLGILSRFPLEELACKRFPTPHLTAVGPHGQPWSLHDKGYITGSIDLGGRTIGLVNGHCFPLHRFGASPLEPRFVAMWEMVSKDLLTVNSTGPAVAAFDLNHEPLGDLLGGVLGPGKFMNAFENTPTTPRGAQRDYILYNHLTTLLTTTVVATESDHSYCQILVSL